MSIFYNITGSSGVTVELIKPGSETNAIKSILLTNTHDTTAATVSLFIQNDPSSESTNSYKLINLVSIPASTSLILDDSSMFSFDKSEYGLYITVGGSDVLDVLINN